MMQQQELEETTVIFLQPLGILASLGCFKSVNRRPRMRLGIAAFTAVTQTIWERDRQIKWRKSLLALKDGKEDQIKQYCTLGYLLSDQTVESRFDSLSESGQADFLASLGSRSDEWYHKHGMPELEHRLNTLYNSRAIFCKSLLVGASLGTLEFSFGVFTIVQLKFRRWLETGKWENRPSDTPLILSMMAGSPLNNLYARLAGVKPFFDEANSLPIAISHMFATGGGGPRTLEMWRTDPMCWYSRKGKLPIFQYNVEEE